MPSLVRLFAAVIVALVGAGCHEDGPTCAPGTIDAERVCVPVVAPTKCGPGTIRKGTRCVPVDDGLDAGGQDASADALDEGMLQDSLLDGLSETGPETDGLGLEVDAPVGDTDSDGIDADAAGPEVLVAPILPPESWTCGFGGFGDGAVCDCDCGAPDPDCEDATHVIANCAAGESCDAQGACVACVPQCDGKACGSDGCGGLCGVCSDPAALECSAQGQCQACTPKCFGDATTPACGDDGCGGTCGECAAGSYCIEGLCGQPTVDASCAGYCQSQAPAGCSCAAGCELDGSCCVDFGAMCGCVPSCVDKQCGSDGCGGQCGSCASDQECVAGTCFASLCGPEACSGNGTCDPSDGSCVCSFGYVGEQCSECDEGLVNYPECVFADCVGVDCDDADACTDDLCVDGGACVYLAVEGCVSE